MRKRIPTFLALVLLMALVGFGLFINFYQKRQNDLQKSILSPQRVMTANLTDISASVIWQTSTPAVGSVILNNSVTVDDRDDPLNPSPRLTHFVTLTGLTPDTAYQYQIKNDSFIAANSDLQFKTVPENVAEKQLSQTSLVPIRGAVLNERQEPVDEGIIVINYTNLSPKATFITTAGNFILPLTKLLNSSHSDVVQIGDNTPATLEIRRGEVVSLVQINLPVKDQILPPITLGKNENLTQFLALPPAGTQPLEFQAKSHNFDLNNDGKINTLDSSLISDFINRRQYNPLADFNNDKVIDDADMEIIKGELK